VLVLSQGLSAVTDAAGFFRIPGTLANLGPVRVRARLVEGMTTLSAASVPLEPQGGQITDAGVLVLAPRGRLIGTSSVQGVNPGSLWEIDVTTGEALYVGTPQGTGQGLSDCSFDPLTGTLYAVHGAATRGAEILLLDPVTASVVDRFVLIGTEIGSGSDGLDWDLSGTLYIGTWRAGFGGLATVDVANDSIATEIQITPPDFIHVSDLAYDATTGQLWASRGGNFPGRLMTLDVATAEVLSTLDIGVTAPITAIAFDNDGVLYASLSGDRLAIIDTSSGDVTLIGSGFGGAKVAGLGFER